MFSFQGASLSFYKKLNEVPVSRSFSQFLMVESTGIEPVTSCLQGRRSPSWANPPYWVDLVGIEEYAKTESVLLARTRFSAEKPRRLQHATGMLSRAAFRVHFGLLQTASFQMPSNTLPCLSFLKWWAKMDSNHRPHDYQSCALASWAIGPYQLHMFRYKRLCTL